MMRLLVRSRSPIGLLKLLLAGCVVLPLGLFAVSSWVAYDDAFSEAARGLDRSADVAREQAVRVLEGQSDVADRVNDILRGIGADAVLPSEQSLHNDLAGVVIRRADVEGVLVVSKDGRPLVSASLYPVPKQLDLTNTDYFKAIVGQRQSLFVTAAQTSAVTGFEFIGLGKPWLGPAGELLGVIDVAVLPEQFRYFYGALVSDPEERQAEMSVSLVRSDGALLARYPASSRPGENIPTQSGFQAAIAAHPDSGVYEQAGRNGRDIRMFTYRRVQGFPVYVIAGRSKRTVIRGWIATVAGHLVFGLPATLGLVLITAIALRRTRREQRALVQARLEIARREQAEAALLRAQRLEAVGQITGGVAHDFNNLLTVILGSAELLSRRPDDGERVRRIADQIILAARRGGDITQQLLSFSRRQFLNPQTVDLNACLREFEPLLQRASLASIKLEYHLDPHLNRVLIDPGHFQAAVLNLVGNARDAMPDGGIITIATSNVRLQDDVPPDLAPGDYIRVRVSDTGTGMDPDTAAKAFEPFFTTKEVGQGTGLGLSQVYGFTKQAGGEVRIVTAPGRGTSIELLLPRTREELPATSEIMRDVPAL